MNELKLICCVINAQITEASWDIWMGWRKPVLEGRKRKGAKLISLMSKEIFLSERESQRPYISEGLRMIQSIPNLEQLAIKLSSASKSFSARSLSPKEEQKRLVRTEEDEQATTARRLLSFAEDRDSSFEKKEENDHIGAKETKRDGSEVEVGG